MFVSGRCQHCHFLAALESSAFALRFGFSHAPNKGYVQRGVRVTASATDTAKAAAAAAAQAQAQAKAQAEAQALLKQASELVAGLGGGNNSGGSGNKGLVSEPGHQLKALGRCKVSCC